MTSIDRVSYLQGRYDVCRLLLTSPRMNKAQRDLIYEQGIEAKEELERLGQGFTEVSSHA